MMAPSEELRRPDKPDKLRPEAGVLKPLKLEIGMAMLVLYISLSVRRLCGSFALALAASSSLSTGLVYHLTEPLMSVARKAFPKGITYLT